ncbi:MAG: hypothetical protein RL291_913 [Pseudomonadota bacterium]
MVSRMRPVLKSAVRGSALLAVALLVAGCGIRGPLEAPAQAGAPPAPGSTAQADSGQGKPANAAPKPHQGFILDGLIR